MNMSTIRVKGDDGKTRELDEERGIVTGDFGQTQLRELSTSDVHIAAAMDNFVTGYGRNQGEAVADIVCPPLLVNRESDYFHTWDKDDRFQDVSFDLIGEDGSIPEISPRKSTDTYSCTPRGLASFVAQGVVANADPRVDPRMAALSRIMNAMTLSREKRVITALQNGTTFASYTAAVTAKWNGGAGSDPIGDLFTAMDAMLLSCTHIVMGVTVAHDFMRNPNVQKFFLNAQGQWNLESAMSLTTRLGLPPIVVGRMKGKSLTAGTYGDLWGTAVTLLHIPPGSDVNAEEVPTARTFRWNKTGSVGAGGFRMRSWFEPSRGQDGGEMIAVLSNDAEKVVAAPTGYLLTGAHA
jgi:hypothetical protein